MRAYFNASSWLSSRPSDAFASREPGPTAQSSRWVPGLPRIKSGVARDDILALHYLGGEAMRARITPHCHSRRAAHGAAREGNPVGDRRAPIFDTWVPFPSHDGRHARPGMTVVEFDGEAVNAPPTRTATRFDLPAWGEVKNRHKPIPLPQRGEGRERVSASGVGGIHP